jgi:Co/Zn/Cd efflux system component
MDESSLSDRGLRRVVRWVALLNLGYFGIEFSIAIAIRSVSLFADSVDFLEDTSINLLIAVALAWSAERRARLGTVLAGILLVPSLATLWAVWEKFTVQTVPAAIPLTLAGTGAFVVNFTCALMLARYRRHSGSLTRAAFLSSRNDVLANVAIVGAGLVTAYTLSVWPDLIVGIGIFLLNANAAREVFLAARDERRLASVGDDD